MKTNLFVQLIQHLRSTVPVFGTAQIGRTKANQAYSATINMINSPLAFSESELSNDFSPLMHQGSVSQTIRGLSSVLSGASTA